MNRILREFFTIFFNPKYMKGFWFDNNSVGTGWVMRGFLFQKVLGVNRNVPFPVSPEIRVSDNPNIIFHVDDLDNFQQMGNYFQCNPGKITLGFGTRIAPNVGIITQNHNKDNPDEFVEPKDVVIGEHCWIGMNTVILPGVHLGDYTIVGAGSIVTKSFPEGHCTIVGNPARRLYDLVE